MVRPHLMPLVIAGPTASGKSALAMKLAEAHNGEIICADSRQFYAGMSIGTAAPTTEDMRQVPHHGYGIVDPTNKKIDAGFFVSFARQAIGEVQKKNKRPILVGGTGFYLRALHYGMHDVPPSDPKIVEAITKRCDEVGPEALFLELKNIDEKTAKLIVPNDHYRIMRALEIYYITKQKPSDLRVSFLNKEPELGAHWVYKKPSKEALLKNITARVHHMFVHGLIEEALALKNRLPADHWALFVMGFEEALSYASHQMTLDAAIERTIIRHRQYAKRQFTWFNKEDFYRFVVA